MKKRLDQHLVDIGLAPSRAKAQELIEAEQVTLNGRIVKKASLLVDAASATPILAEKNALKFVSRSGFKLENVIQKLNLDVSGMRALDVGQSTGGFTDCLLQYGADQVVGVDVADNQLAEKLRHHPRVQPHFHINARELTQHKVQLGGDFDLVAIDVSFISLEKVLPEVIPFLKAKATLLALIKPQFEVGSVNLDKRGVVKSSVDLNKSVDKLVEFAQNLGLGEIQTHIATPRGKDGNQEFFLHAKKP